MSTRGLRIIRFRGRYFIYYNHSDSYPTGLGIDIVSNIPTAYSQIDIAQQFPDVTFIDTTYQTNHYNMPLIHFMVVVTSYRKTVSVAMCFVPSEAEAMYNRAIRAFKTLVIGNAKIEVFLTDDDSSLKSALSLYYPDTPQLLCLWHVNTATWVT
jgi:MULE transposase domain